MSRELLRRAIDAQVRCERAEIAAADKRALRDKAIREARAEHPAAHIAQATGLSRERVRQIVVTSVVRLLLMAGGGVKTPASCHSSNSFLYFSSVPFNKGNTTSS